MTRGNRLAHIDPGSLQQFDCPQKLIRRVGESRCGISVPGFGYVTSHAQYLWLRSGNPSSARVAHSSVRP